MDQETLRIAGRTLTTKGGITLTTEVRVRHTPDVFIENAVLTLRGCDTERTSAIGAVTWSLTGRPASTAHAVAARFAIGAIHAKLNRFAVYLLAGHTAVQPDTRIARHRGLWSSLSARGFPIVGEDLGESILPAGTGLRCFGLRRLEESGIALAVAILEEERASILVAIPEQDEAVLIRAVEKGWPAPGLHPNLDLLFDLVGAGGVAMWPVGSFDDPELGFAAVAPPDVIEELLVPGP